MNATQQTTLNAMNTARTNVFATEELFEGILSFLPFKTLFYIRRVSKRWASVIDGSVTLQQKMFLRPRDEPELWIVERKHKVGAHQFEGKYEHLNDTELKFRRVKVLEDDERPITPVALNPLLEDGNNTVTRRSNILRMAVGCEFEEATYSGWTDAFWDQGHGSPTNASFWNTFLTDPPCHKIDVYMFGLRLDDTAPPSQPSKDHPNPIVAALGFPEHQRLTIESDAGVRMRDVLPPCLTARGFAQGGRAGRWLWNSRDATIRDAVEAMKERVGSQCISKRWGLFLRLRLYRVGGAQPLLATDEERTAANVDWK
jgi:hypothetical protein